MHRNDILAALGLADQNSGLYVGGWQDPSGSILTSYNPATEEPIAEIVQASLADYETAISEATDAFDEWRMLPAPRRGDYVRRIGNALREYKEQLGALVALEMGKIKA